MMQNRKPDAKQPENPNCKAAYIPQLQMSAPLPQFQNPAIAQKARTLKRFTRSEVETLGRVLGHEWPDLPEPVCDGIVKLVDKAHKEKNEDWVLSLEVSAIQELARSSAGLGDCLRGFIGWSRKRFDADLSQLSFEDERERLSALRLSPDALGRAVAGLDESNRKRLTAALNAPMSAYPRSADGRAGFVRTLLDSNCVSLSNEKALGRLLSAVENEVLLCEARLAAFRELDALFVEKYPKSAEPFPEHWRPDYGNPGSPVGVPSTKDALDVKTYFDCRRTIAETIALTSSFEWLNAAKRLAKQVITVEARFLEQGLADLKKTTSVCPYNRYRKLSVYRTYESRPCGGYAEIVKTGETKLTQYEKGLGLQTIRVPIYSKVTRTHYEDRLTGISLSTPPLEIPKNVRRVIPWAAAAIAWASSYMFLDIPPPQRFIVPSQRAEYIDAFERFGGQSIFERIQMAEKAYRRSHQ